MNVLRLLDASSLPRLLLIVIEILNSLFLLYLLVDVMHAVISKMHVGQVPRGEVHRVYCNLQQHLRLHHYHPSLGVR